MDVVDRQLRVILVGTDGFLTALAMVQLIEHHLLELASGGLVVGFLLALPPPRTLLLVELTLVSPRHRLLLAFYIVGLDAADSRKHGALAED